MTCVEFIDCLGTLISVFLAGFALWQNRRYKEQADTFADLQYMPEFFLADEDGYIPPSRECGSVQTSSLGYGYTQNLGKYFAINTPIYNLEISEVVISGARVDIGAKVQRKKANVYPTNPYFNILISIPEEITHSKERHKGKVILTYENMYGTKYKKEIGFVYERVSSEHTIHSREIKNKRAERKNGTHEI